MAGSSHENRRVQRGIDRLSEEEEMNRFLIAAGMYDAGDTFSQKKDLIRVLKESAEAGTKNDDRLQETQYPPRALSSRDNSYSSSEDKHLPKTSNGPIRRFINRPLSEDEDEKSLILQKPSQSRRREDKPAEQVVGNRQNILHTEQQGRRFSTDTYAGKMLAAAEKANKQGNSHAPASPSQLITPAKGINRLKISDNGPSESSGEVQMDCLEDDQQQQATETSSGATSHKTALPERLESVSYMQVPVVRLPAMKARCKNLANMLNMLLQLSPVPQPEVLDFNKKGAYQQLVERERERAKLAASCFASENVKQWRKPISLSTLSNNRRKQPFRPPSAPATPPRSNSRTSDVVDLIFDDSPPTHVAQKSTASNVRLPDPSKSTLWDRVGNEDDTETERGSVIPDRMVVDVEESTDDNPEFHKCPICLKLFPSTDIEVHADGCFNYDCVEEEPIRDQRTRSTRAAVVKTRSRSRQDQIDEPRGNTRATESSPQSATDPDWEKVDSDSDFEPGDSGSKRNRKQDVSKGKKRRM